jgi:hypothetical protein
VCLCVKEQGVSCNHGPYPGPYLQLAYRDKWCVFITAVPITTSSVFAGNWSFEFIQNRVFEGPCKL